MPIGDVYRMSVQHDINGQRHANVLHFQDTLGTFGDPEFNLREQFDPTAGGDSVMNTMHAFMRGFSSFTNHSLTVQLISPTLGLPRTFGINHASLGALDSGLPTICQAGIIIQTAQGGRSGTGGFHLSGIVEGQSVGNDLNATATGNLQNIIDAFFDVFIADEATFLGFALGVWSRTLLTFFTATEMSFLTRIGSMTSRRPGTGI